MPRLLNNIKRDPKAIHGSEIGQAGSEGFTWHNPQPDRPLDRSHACTFRAGAPPQSSTQALFRVAKHPPCQSQSPEHPDSLALAALEKGGIPRRGTSKRFSSPTFLVLLRSTIPFRSALLLGFYPASEQPQQQEPHTYSSPRAASFCLVFLRRGSLHRIQLHILPHLFCGVLRDGRERGGPLNLKLPKRHQSQCHHPVAQYMKKAEEKGAFLSPLLVSDLTFGAVSLTFASLRN